MLFTSYAVITSSPKLKSFDNFNLGIPQCCLLVVKSSPRSLGNFIIGFHYPTVLLLVMLAVLTSRSSPKLQSLGNFIIGFLESRVCQPDARFFPGSLTSRF